MDRGKPGIKRSMAVDASGIPLGATTAPANRHDSPLLVPTLEAVAKTLGGLSEQTSVHLDRGYDSNLIRERLEELGLGWAICRGPSLVMTIPSARRSEALEVIHCAP